MILDLKTPTLVLLGVWNVPIFSPQWLTRHLFDYPAGADVPLVQIVASSPGDVRQVLYIRNQGIHVEPGRIDLYANRDGQGFTRLEDLGKRLLATLPHTPIGALGINFRFVVLEAPNELLHKLDTNEGLSEHYQVNRTVIQSWTADGNFQCRIQREITENGSMIIDFNYHWETFGEQADKAAALTGIIAARLTHARAVLETIYDEPNYQAVGHDFAPEMGTEWEEE